MSLSDFPHGPTCLSREPVDPPRSPLGIPVLPMVSYAYMPSPLPRQVQRSLFLVHLLRRQPSLWNRQVGSFDCSFEAVSVHSRYGLPARGVADATLSPRLRPLCYLRDRFDSYRVGRTCSRAGVAPAEVRSLSRRTVTTAITQGAVPAPALAWITSVLERPTLRALGE